MTERMHSVLGYTGVGVVWWMFIEKQKQFPKYLAFSVQTGFSVIIIFFKS